MSITRPFVIREEPTPEVVELLESVTLGTNGARYRHLDTPSRIAQLYQPLFLTLERNEKVIGNITFCRRPCGAYVRYFAFAEDYQNKTKNQKESKKEGYLKSQIKQFFKNALEGKQKDLKTDLFYAFIDPRNERSLWMSQSFGFKPVAKIATQSFSRIKPKQEKSVMKLTDKHKDLVKEKVKGQYKDYSLYFDHHTFNESPFYGFFEDNELVALTKVHRAKWVIERLPSRSGGFLRAVIPYVPGLRKLITPDEHSFAVIDSLWYRSGDPKLLTSFFEGILYEEKVNSFIWWVDQKDPVYKQVKKSVNWGLMHKLNGVSEIDLVMLKNATVELNEEKPFYTTGFDFI